MREQLPKAFPGATFSFLPADIVSQILNFGSPAPLDVQIAGDDLDASRAFANKLLAKIRHVPGVADPRIQEQFQDPALKVDFNRELAGVVGLTESDAATSIQATLSGSTQTAPTYWLNPTNGVSYAVSVQTPQYRHRYARRSQKPAVDRRAVDAIAGRPRDLSPEPLDAVVSHYDIRNAVNIYATTQDRDLGGVAADIQKIVDDFARRSAQGLDGLHPRPSRDDDQRLSATADRPGLLDRADLPADRRQLPVLARSVRHHHGASRRVGRHRLDAVRHPHHAVGAGA